MSVVNTNVLSLNAQNSLMRTNSQLSTAMERLASGLRVNSSKDDAAGLAIANNMTAQIRGMTVAQRNANDGISLAQVADGSLSTVTDTLLRMRDLAVQAANSGGLSGDDKDKLQVEYGELQAEVTRIIESTTFNGKEILGGSLASGAVFQVGANTTSNDKITVTIGDVAAASGVAAVVTATNSIGAAGNPATAMTNIDAALGEVDDIRAQLGAVQNRLTATIGNLANAIENQSAARSRILDADFAVETANLSRAQILQQAGTAVLSQANVAPQSVLSLLG